MTPLEITLAPRLQAGNERDAIHLLRTYYAKHFDGGMGYEGGWWDDFDPSGTRDASPNVFTADDVLSASLLSAPIHPTAVLAILNEDVRAGLPMKRGWASGEESGTLSEQLDQLGADRDLATLETEEVRELEATNLLWRDLRRIPTLGRTRVSKLMARKRPRLVPIFDDVVGRAVYGGCAEAQWVRMHAALTANDCALNRRLKALHSEAGLPAEVSLLRVFDVIAWLDASGKGDELLARRGEERSAARR